MESVVRALVVWIRANLLLLLTLAGVVVGVILGAVLSWRPLHALCIPRHECKTINFSIVANNIMHKRIKRFL